MIYDLPGYAYSSDVCLSIITQVYTFAPPLQETLVALAPKNAEHHTILCFSLAVTWYFTI